MSSAEEASAVPGAEPSSEQYGTVREAATAYAISERAIIKRLSAGSLVGHRIGKTWRVKLPEPSAEPSEPSSAPVRNPDTPLIEALQADLLFLRSELTAQREARDQADSEFRRLLLSRDMEIVKLRGEVQRLLMSAPPVDIESEPVQEPSPMTPGDTQDEATALTVHQPKDVVETVQEVRKTEKRAWWEWWKRDRK